MHFTCLCSICSLEEIEATFSAIQDTFGQLVKRLPYHTPKTTKSLHKALTMLFYTAAKYKQCCSSDANLAGMADERIERMLTQVRKSLTENWIVLHFSPVFGEPIAMHHIKKYRKAEEDVQVNPTSNSING